MLAETQIHSGSHGKGGEGKNVEGVMEADSWREVVYINDAYCFRYVDKIIGKSGCSTLKSALVCDWLFVQKNCKDMQPCCDIR